MLLHDSYFYSSNKSINTTHHDIITIAYSPLFHSTFTLIISIFGSCLNLICCVKLWFTIYQYRKRKLKRTPHRGQQPQPQQLPSDESIHVLSHNKYRFLFILTTNDFLLCLSAIISCLDEKYFFQSYLARHHLCAAHISLWKFTLHFIPLLIIVILCRYHYILYKQFQVKYSNLSTLNQLLCTDLCILIPFVLALAWSVDGLWLWGVANVKDFFMPPPTSSDDSKYYHNQTTEISTFNSSINATNINTASLTSTLSLIRSDEKPDTSFYLPEQKTICHLQTNYNYNFSVRLVHLIQADFLLLFSLHLFALFLEILLHIRLCCYVSIKKAASSLNQERQLCIYILYTFIILTLTSLPIYSYRSIEIIFDIQLTSTNSELINSRTFAQILLFGACFKPLLVFILFFPSSILFKLKCYLKCYSPTNIQIIQEEEEEEQIVTPMNNQKKRISHQQQQQQPQQSITHSPYHRYSLLTSPTYYSKFHTKLRTQSNPILSTNNNSEHVNSWLQLTNSIITKNSTDTSNGVYV